jgi:hypothetical protein
MFSQAKIRALSRSETSSPQTRGKQDITTTNPTAKTL